MLYTRDMVVRKLSDKTGFFMRDIKTLLLALDDTVEELLGEATDDEDINIQLIRGCKISNHIVGERHRRDPRTQDDIICKPEPKVWAKISETLKENLQNKYNENGKA